MPLCVWIFRCFFSQRELCIVLSAVSTHSSTIHRLTAASTTLGLKTGNLLHCEYSLALPKSDYCLVYEIHNSHIDIMYILQVILSHSVPSPQLCQQERYSLVGTLLLVFTNTSVLTLLCSLSGCHRTALEFCKLLLA